MERNYKGRKLLWGREIKIDRGKAGQQCRACMVDDVAA